MLEGTNLYYHQFAEKKIDFIQQFAEEEVETTAAMMDDDEVSNILFENEDGKNFIDHSMETESQQHPSDYFELRNVTRLILSAENDAFLLSLNMTLMISLILMFKRATISLMDLIVVRTMI